MAAFDVIVIGLGVMGSATVDALARRGLAVLGIDRFGPTHELGSSHGRARAIRLAHGEDPAYAPMMLRAVDLWRDLERRSRETIMTMTGVLEIGRNSGSGMVDGSLKVAREYGLMHQLLDRDEIMRRYPVFDIPSSYIGVYQSVAGILRPEVAVRSFQRLAAEAGARLHFGEKVVGINPRADSIEVVTDEGMYECGHVVVAVGSWVAKLVPDLQGLARPTRQVSGWFWPKDPHLFSIDRLPVFAIDDGVMGEFYAFPSFEEGGLKVARHGHLNEVLDPDGMRLPVNERDIVILRSFLARRVPMLDGEPVRTQGCIYTNLPDGKFLIDFLPADSRIVVASPCSGYGFKFAPVIGEIAADLIQSGKSAFPIESLGFQRLQALRGRRMGA